MDIPQPQRRVRALRKAYVNHIVRKEGDEFMYSGDANANVFLELDAGDTSPVQSNVPREVELTVGDDIDDLL